MKTNTSDILSYYATHSAITDPGPYAFLYDDLPDEAYELIPVIQGLLLHYYTAQHMKLQLSSLQRREQYLRTMRQRLAQINKHDPAPLTVPRELKELQIGRCREYAVFLVSMLRHKGVPARMRVGFETYFVDEPFNGDHWITEYWDTHLGRWRLIDADIGGAEPGALEERMRKKLKPGLDFTDLRPAVDFNVAANIWKQARAGEVKPDLYRANREWKGYPCIRGNMLHDFQALNKTELTLWDYWDELSRKSESEINARDRELLDTIAELTLHPDDSFEKMRSFFEELPRTRVIRSRLHLMGVTTDEPFSVADGLFESDWTRLLTMAAGGSGTQDAQPEELPPEIETPATHDEVQQERHSQHEGADGIWVLGARQNNLKNIDVHIPRDKLVVITGVSGSGKSSLAFDTIYAEGQRRYVESLSSFARQFTKQMEKPQVDKVIGLNPAVAIEQRTISPNSRSTVGSITEIIDYLRLLFARVGQMHCPQCGRAVSPLSAQQIARRLVNLPPGTQVQVLAPVNRFSRLDASQLLEQAHIDGFSHARLDGVLIDLEERGRYLDGEQGSERQIELLLAELHVPVESSAGPGSEFYTRTQQAVDAALELGKDIVVLLVEGEELRLGGERVCPYCAISLPKLEPQLLNPNTVYGMCHECDGLGLKLQVDPDLIITKPHRSLLDDASGFYPYRNMRKSTSDWWRGQIEAIAEYFNADLEQPWNELPEAFRHAIIFGTGGEKIPIEFGAEDGSFSVQRNRELQGTIHHINRLYRQTKSESQRRRYMQFMRQQPCPACDGERLGKEARFVTLDGKRFPELTDKSIGALLTWIRSLKPNLDEQQREIGGELLAEIEQRLGFICDVGLHYLSLDRPAPTLSGGEAQRIRLASQIGSELMGVLYVLDEPSIGLHSRDQSALLELLKHLRDAGNTVLVVEHDAETMRTADWLIDLGPGAGVLGGELVAAGIPADVIAVPESLTGQYLSGKLSINTPQMDQLRTPKGWLTITGARLHNLKALDAHFPLGTFTCITGVSGSGKSSLITRTLSPALARLLQNAQDVPGPFDGLEGVEQVARVIHITSAPIGRNPRSNPGTYVGALNEVRKVFARSEAAAAAGYSEGHFSFNTQEGRCEACEGYGANKIKMHFMADVWVRCKECQGKRFTPQVLEVRYQGVNIADVLDMDVQQALELFKDHPKIRRVLGTMMDVGLGYLKLGQSALTLSGGEAQRVKLARELSRSSTGNIFYILDEPTTGLHFVDIQKLLDILHRLVDAGNTVIVIEHNLEVIKTADWIIDLGPEGGDEGGCIVAEGSPQDIILVEESYTGKYLKGVYEMTH